MAPTSSIQDETSVVSKNKHETISTDNSKAQLPTIQWERNKTKLNIVQSRVTSEEKRPGFLPKIDTEKSIERISNSGPDWENKNSDRAPAFGQRNWDEKPGDDYGQQKSTKRNTLRGPSPVEQSTSSIPSLRAVSNQNRSNSQLNKSASQKTKETKPMQTQSANQGRKLKPFESKIQPKANINADLQVKSGAQTKKPFQSSPIKTQRERSVSPPATETKVPVKPQISKIKPESTLPRNVEVAKTTGAQKKQFFPPNKNQKEQNKESKKQILEPTKNERKVSPKSQHIISKSVENNTKKKEEPYVFSHKGQVIRLDVTETPQDQDQAQHSLKSITDQEEYEDDEFDPTSTNGLQRGSVKDSVVDTTAQIQTTKLSRAKRYAARVQVPEHERIVAIPAVDYKFRVKPPLNCHITKTIQYAIETAEKMKNSAKTEQFATKDNSELQSINETPLKNGRSGSAYQAIGSRRNDSVSRQYNSAQPGGIIDRLSKGRQQHLSERTHRELLLLPPDLKHHEGKLYQIQQLREIQRFMVEVLQVIATNKLKDARRENTGFRGSPEQENSAERKQNANMSEIQSVAGSVVAKPVSKTQAAIRKLEATLTRVKARHDQLSDPYYLHQLKKDIKAEQQKGNELMKFRGEIESQTRVVAADLARLLKQKARTAEKETQGAGAAENLQHNQVKSALCEEKFEKAQEALSNAQAKLREAKDKQDKLVIIAEKYDVDPSRTKEYLKGEPDAEAQQVEKKLEKATEVQKVAKVKRNKIQEKFKEIAERKRLLALKIKDKKEALHAKMKASQQLMERGLKLNQDHPFEREDSKQLSSLSVATIKVEKFLSNYVPSAPAPSVHTPGTSPKRPKGLPVGMKIESSDQIRKSMAKAKVSTSQVSSNQSIVHTGNLLNSLVEAQNDGDSDNEKDLVRVGRDDTAPRAQQVDNRVGAAPDKSQTITTDQYSDDDDEFEMPDDSQDN